MNLACWVTAVNEESGFVIHRWYATAHPHLARGGYPAVILFADRLPGSPDAVKDPDHAPGGPLQGTSQETFPIGFLRENRFCCK